MEQQRRVDHDAAAVERRDGLPPREAGCAATSTVVPEGEWLAASTEGFSEQQRSRLLAHLVKEMVQNALDSVGGAGRIALELARPGHARPQCAAPTMGRVPRA